MLLLGIDIGTSSVKVSVTDAATAKTVASLSYPETERDIISIKPGWAEQDPAQWWDDVQTALLKLHAQKKYDPLNIAAIGITYQMHGLVCVDAAQNILRNSIIWCDSRAVEIGNAAFEKIGREKCLSHLLNSPGNFTAAKLGWVKENEPALYAKIDKIMLPGDFIAMKLTGEITTSASALSEGIFWDFKTESLSKNITDHFGFDHSLIPELKNMFDDHGYVIKEIADKLQLRSGIPVSYKAGDQPNNALSLNVLQPGEVAANAGTSGVIYAVSDGLTYDKLSRVNSFAHVNHLPENKRIGVLLCINGCGIMNSRMKTISGEMDYETMNAKALTIEQGSKGLAILPFGNGAERMLDNKNIGAHITNLDLNKHTNAHLYRATQEGIAFAFRYGLDIMRENNIKPDVIRAGKTNMFLSDVFTEAFVNTANIPVELYESDGSTGAAIGAGIGAKIYSDAKDAFVNFRPVKTIEPRNGNRYEAYYQHWKRSLQKYL